MKNRFKTSDCEDISNYIKTLYVELKQKYECDKDSYLVHEQKFVEAVIQGLGSSANYITCMGDTITHTTEECMNRMLAHVKDYVKKLDEGQNLQLN